MSVELTGAEIFVRCLQEQGVEHVFGYPGGAVLHIYDALYQQDRIRHILVRHEQAAVHAAEGYAKSSGRPGVVLVSGRPSTSPPAAVRAPSWWTSPRTSRPRRRPSTIPST